ncbi:MAG: antibiotic biosynthesis monooxygenase [Sphingomonadales bacterium]|nr:antibiotic biosynthesis monooxygenase [Sphingomonadales bacterium]
MMIQWNLSTPPQPPFIASIFHYYLGEDLTGYQEYDELTLALVKEMPGYLGYESFKHDGRGSFISYWNDMEAVRNWARHPIHMEAKEKGKASWYRYYHSAICEVNSLHVHSAATQ